ncbi:class I SAM-dependent methyltransferase [Carnobacteriaceae bacterium zg-ZUI78]|nr:class I SAM-dependent methyltransferase [Carnobacteriaceae bacterium zg-ZUI78]
MSFIVTTSVETTNTLNQKAKHIAHIFDVTYFPRQKTTLKSLCQQFSHVLVVYKDKLMYTTSTSQFFFHPNTAIIRIKQQKEPLLELIGSTPKRVLDTTMGLASDSIVLSYFGYDVVALEDNPLIHFIIEDGLKTYDTHHTSINQAMKRINTHCIHSLDYLMQCNDKAFDIVYADPMFRYAIDESKNLEGLSSLANKETITTEWIEQAKRVAKEKVIIKAHYKDTLFETFGFTRLVRKHAQFHYGYIDV